MNFLLNKFNLYKDLVRTHQDKDGFILTSECDSVGFSALIGCVEGVDVNIDAANPKPGLWLRRPTAYPECLTCAQSKSTISRDMLLMIAWFSWCNKRLDISEGVIKYALKNFGVMGKGPLSRTFIGPGLLATFAWISYKLGGPSRSWLRVFNPGFKITSGVTGFQAHLQTLHFHLRAEVTGREQDRWLAHDVAYHHARRSAGYNPYFNFVAGGSEGILHSDNYFPKDRLPTTREYSAEWLWERDLGTDWMPSDQASREHTGGDFLWAAAWYLGKIKGK